MGLFQFKVGWFKIKAGTNLGPQNYMYISGAGFGGTKDVTGKGQRTHKVLINLIEAGGGAMCPYKFFPDCAKTASSKQMKLSYRALYQIVFSVQ